jgi:class 3 adenylate cyclase/tetratricopeptide (TPR) repeat protein
MSAKPICPSCGSENEAAAVACRVCGRDLTVSTPAETRKVVTVLFSDVKGSTPLGQELDPESLRGLMQRYFNEMEDVIERHGGTVEKFIGDAVVAVFGVPRLHEDDALRAVRAAAEMRDRLAALNEEFQRSWGVVVDTRTGVNTGEVIAGDPATGQSFVVGDAVNLAGRLEQTAQANEILIGAATERLVRDAVVAEETGPLTMKGFPEPLPAWRVLEVIPEAPGWARSLDLPLVGRGHELGRLKEAFTHAVEQDPGELVTLMGPAGVGKSRLVHEFVSEIEDRATVIRGRCLPYGDGITFWPIVGVLRDAAGIRQFDSSTEARTKISALLPQDGDDAALVSDRLAGLLGLGTAAPGIQETFWAVRRLFEELATSRPLVVIFDDIHWGEATFLDLVEYLGAFIRRAPVFIVCITRPEIQETRPGWASGTSTGSLMVLEPLTESEIDGLIANLLGGDELDLSSRRRIGLLAEGNPLFLEQTIRMLLDEDQLRRSDGHWTLTGDQSTLSIPGTIQAVLAARLDRLEPDERAAIQRASVIGRVFWWDAVSELADPDEQAEVSHALQSLVRKGLVQPDHSEIQQDAFRFGHILIRDAAYGAIPKSARAELHERFAGWIAVRTRELAGEYEEILGWHLDQAYTYSLELGLPTERAEALAQRAAAPLGSAGLRAFARGDMRAAVKLLSRATSLRSAEDSHRSVLLPQLAFALMETGDFEGLQSAVEEMGTAAATSGDPGLRAHVSVLNLWIRLFTNPQGWTQEAEREGTRAVEEFEQAGDERGLTKAWSLLGLVHILRCHFVRAEHAWREAAAHAERAGDRRDELESLAWVPLMILAGPTEAEAGLTRSREFLERVAGDKKATASAWIASAVFEAELGRFDEARGLIGRARALLEEAELTVWRCGPLAQFAGWAELLAGDAVAAERELRAGYDELAKIGEAAWLSTVAAILAEAVYVQGRDDEAAELTTASESTSLPEDVYSHAMWRSVRAKIHARRGEADEAEALAREAVELTRSTDFLLLRWQVLMSLTEVLELLGRADEVEPVLREAIAVAEDKGNVVGAQLARDRLERPSVSRRTSSG